MKSIVEISHDYLDPVLHRQAVCIDATLGHGNDSLFFQNAGVREIHAFEIQENLLEETSRKFSGPAFHAYLKSHDQMEDVLSEYAGKVDAVIFNFGWDPKIPGSLTTKTSSSVEAVRQAVDLLRPKGRMSLVFYPHAEGEKEKQAILESLGKRSDISVLTIEHPFVKSPSLALIEKKKKKKKPGKALPTNKDD